MGEHCIRHFAFSGTAGCVLINASAMSYYSPYALMLNIFLIDALTFAFMGMLLYTLSLFVSKIWSYVIVVVLTFFAICFGKMGLVWIISCRFHGYLLRIGDLDMTGTDRTLFTFTRRFVCYYFYWL